MNEQISPKKILQLGFGFWASKTLLSAVELKLFTHLENKSLDHDTLVAKLQLGSRGTRDFFDALVALGVLEIQDGVRHVNRRLRGSDCEGRTVT